MKKSSIKKYSILGLVLVAASAVTAAILPSNATTDIPGKLVFDSTDGIVDDEPTCVPSTLNECRVTVPTFTTTDGNPDNGRQPNGSSAPATLGNTTS